MLWNYKQLLNITIPTTFSREIACLYAIEIINGTVPTKLIPAELPPLVGISLRYVP